MEPIEYFDVQTRAGNQRVLLDGDRLSIGRSESNDLTLPADQSVSRVHAVVERLPSGWTIRDLGSHNGTLVNGKRIWGDAVLWPGDEVSIGAARLTLGRTPSAGDDSRTLTAGRAPELTRREREVLVALCRPASSADVFTEPASIRELARSLFITEAAVKQHLTHLYDKFGIQDSETERRRVRLANEAVRRGVVTIADLRSTTPAG